MKFATQFEYIPNQVEMNSLPSMTEPDQTMSIPEIIQRFVRGLPVDSKVYPNVSGMVADEVDFDPLDQQISPVKAVSQSSMEKSLSESSEGVKTPENGSNAPAPAGAPA